MSQTGLYVRPLLPSVYLLATGAYLLAHLQLAAVRHSPLLGLTDFVHVSESDDSNDDPEGDGAFGSAYRSTSTERLLP